jgi:hypothetical protein
MATENYIYLLRTREFVTANQNVYKIGRTNQTHTNRFKQYPKGSELILQYSCNDCIACEKGLLYIFRVNYIKRKDIGSEYFEGDVVGMKRDIHNFIDNEEDNVINTNELINEEKIQKKLEKQKQIQKQLEQRLALHKQAELAKQEEKQKQLTIELELKKQLELAKQAELEKQVEINKQKSIIKKDKKYKPESHMYDFTCERCGLSFNEKRVLLTHLKRLKWCIAVEKDIEPSKLIENIKSKPDGKSCDKCNKIYKNNNSLRMHKCKKLLSNISDNLLLEDFKKLRDELKLLKDKILL